MSATIVDFPEAYRNPSVRAHPRRATVCSASTGLAALAAVGDGGETELRYMQLRGAGGANGGVDCRASACKRTFGVAAIIMKLNL